MSELTINLKKIIADILLLNTFRKVDCYQKSQKPVIMKRNALRINGLKNYWSYCIY